MVKSQLFNSENLKTTTVAMLLVLSYILVDQQLNLVHLVDEDFIKVRAQTVTHDRSIITGPVCCTHSEADGQSVRYLQAMVDDEVTCSTFSEIKVELTLRQTCWNTSLVSK